MNNLSIKKLELGPISTNAFLIWEEKGEEAILIDVPPDSVNEIKPFLVSNHLTLKEVWLTHGHWDHIAGVHQVVSPDTKVIGHRADEVMFENPQLMSGFSLPGVSLVPVKVNHWVKEGEILDLWGREVFVLHTPGHCPGNISFYLKAEKICFVGDVIFSGSVGRTDLPGGSFELLRSSILQKVYTLPDETELAVGHGPNTTVGREKFTNPYVHI